MLYHLVIGCMIFKVYTCYLLTINNKFNIIDRYMMYNEIIFQFYESKNKIDEI